MSSRRSAALIALALLLAIVGLPSVFDLTGGVDEWLPGQSSFIDLAAERRIHYREAGSEFGGEAVVLVHGTPSASSEWSSLPGKLAARAKRRVIAYDRVGYGFSDRADPDDPEQYTQASSAEDLLGLLDALAIKRATLVGWSYGGAVVQTFAVAHPARVRRVVFVGSTGPASDSDARESAVMTMIGSRWGLAVLRWAGRIPPIARIATRGELGAAFSGAEAIPQGWTESTAALIALPGTLQAFAAEVERNDPAALRPEEIRAPALVLHGTDDRLVAYEVAEDLAARLPDSKLVPFVEGSHMLPATRPDRVAEEISLFLGS